MGRVRLASKRGTEGPPPHPDPLRPLGRRGRIQSGFSLPAEAEGKSRRSYSASGNKTGQMPKLCGAFQDLGDAENRLLVEGATGDLQAERQTVAREPGRDRDRRQAG